MAPTKYLWRERRRSLLGLPLSSTVYKQTKKNLIIETGLRSKKEEEIPLRRIHDIVVSRSMSESLFGLGTVHCFLDDQPDLKIVLRHIKHPTHVEETLFKWAKKARAQARTNDA